jgi:hypothetical protein
MALKNGKKLQIFSTMPFKLALDAGCKRLFALEKSSRTGKNMGNAHKIKLSQFFNIS